MSLAACGNFNPSVLDWLPSSSVSNSLPYGEIAGRNLNAAVWAGRDFRGQTFENISFLKADLSGTNFNGAYISNVDFTLADLSRASFRGATLRNVTFYGARLRGVDFTDAGLEVVMLDAADVRGTCFQRASLEDVYFEGARLSGGVYPEQTAPIIWPRSFYALLEQGHCPGGVGPSQALYAQGDPELSVSPNGGPQSRFRGTWRLRGDDTPREQSEN
ncbi:pentapeptide repeat-containing protein [Pseudovibrio flavus]|uniref:pentapeptide repeat-containing protein n=1 Tax=Pseudovibrio flavus TaxID=2529854 RepID=UPI00211CA3FB|nr:pentapeptide repeat-containing protein [Pseudovibrio flavus]